MKKFSDQNLDLVAIDSTACCAVFPVPRDRTRSTFVGCFHILRASHSAISIGLFRDIPPSSRVSTPGIVYGLKYHGAADVHRPLIPYQFRVHYEYQSETTYASHMCI